MSPLAWLKHERAVCGNGSVRFIVSWHGETRAYANALALGDQRAGGLAYLASGARVLCERSGGGADRGRGDWTGECDSGTVSQSHYISSHHPDTGTVLVVHQRGDAGAGFGICARLPHPEFPGGILGRDRAHVGE